MKTITSLISFSVLLLCSVSSFAMDQVILSSGEIVEGKVLSDVPNRHVDIQLINGQKRRYTRDQVASVERDVPSNRDGDMMGVNRRIFFAPMAGLILNMDSGLSEFGFGAKFGVNTANLGGATFAPALSYRVLFSSSGTTSGSLHFIDTQFLFKRLGSSGFYVGPQAGLLVLSGSNGTYSATGSFFSVGANLGYDIQLSDSFSIGPDLNYNHAFTGAGANLLSFMLAGTFHFE
jgi:hypothetical protein